MKTAERFARSAAAVLALSAALPLHAAGSPDRTATRRSGGESLILRDEGAVLVCRDADGSEISVPKSPRRAIVNYVSFVSIWYRSGGAAVGIPETDARDAIPPAARSAASTGRATAPNVERVLDLRPDLLILPANIEKQRALKDIAADNGIPALTIAYETYADYRALAELFAAVNGGDPEHAAMEMRIERVAAEARKRPAVRFLSLFASSRSILAETDAAHAAFMASYLGGTNVAAAIGGGTEQRRVALSAERLVLEDPDLILITTMGDADALRATLERDLFSEEPWRSMRAVRNGRVHFLPNELFLFKPNERFPEAFELVAALMAPEAAR